jgi:hypothetical protein
MYWRSVPIAGIQSPIESETQDRHVTICSCVVLIATGWLLNYYYSSMGNLPSNVRDRIERSNGTELNLKDFKLKRFKSARILKEKHFRVRSKRDCIGDHCFFCIPRIAWDTEETVISNTICARAVHFQLAGVHL